MIKAGDTILITTEDGQTFNAVITSKGGADTTDLMSLKYEHLKIYQAILLRIEFERMGWRKISKRIGWLNSHTDLSRKCIDYAKSKDQQSFTYDEESKTFSQNI